MLQCVKFCNSVTSGYITYVTLCYDTLRDIMLQHVDLSNCVTLRSVTFCDGVTKCYMMLQFDRFDTLRYNIQLPFSVNSDAGGGETILKQLKSSFPSFCCIHVRL